MLRQGITKRGEVVHDDRQNQNHRPEDEGDHHAAVHSILRSRRRAATKRAGGALSGSGSRILSLGIRAASPGPGAGRYGGAVSSTGGNDRDYDGAGRRSGSGRESLTSRSNSPSPPAEEEKEAEHPSTHRDNNYADDAGSPESQRTEKAKNCNRNCEAILSTDARKSGNNEGETSSNAPLQPPLESEQGNEAAARDEEADMDAQEASHKLRVEQQLAMALQQQRDYRNNKRGQSLSRRLLGRRGRSQQARGNRYGEDDGHSEYKQRTTNAGRSLSPSHYAPRPGDEQSQSSANARVDHLVHCRQAVADPNPAEEADYSHHRNSSPHNNSSNNNNELPSLFLNRLGSGTTNGGSSDEKMVLASDEAGPLPLREDRLRLLPPTRLPPSQQRQQQQQDDLRSSQASILSQSSSSLRQTTTTRASIISKSSSSNGKNEKRSSKSKKLWNKVRVWKKNSSSSSSKNNSKNANSDNDNRPIVKSISSKGSGSEGNDTSESQRDGNYSHDGDDYEYECEYDGDAPWAPTMSMLVRTGQLDRIESDSDEDGEGGLNEDEGNDGGGVSNAESERIANNGGNAARDNMMYGQKPPMPPFASKASNEPSLPLGAASKEVDGSGRSGSGSGPFLDDSGRSSKGYDIDDFMNVPDTNANGPRDIASSGNNDEHGDNNNEHSSGHDNNNDSQDSMNRFFHSVASTYLSQRAEQMGWEVDCCDKSAISRNDESTLSKEDAIMSSRRNSKDASGGGSGSNGESASPEKKGRSGLSGIRSLSESIVRRGRSRGRRKNRHRQGAEYTTGATTDASGNRPAVVAPSRIKDGYEVVEKDESRSQVAASASNNSAPTTTRRSRSLFRRVPDILRNSLNNKHPEEESEPPIQAPKRVMSLDNSHRSNNNDGDGDDDDDDDDDSSPRGGRNTKSLPRKASRTHSTRNTTLSSFHDDSRASLFDNSSNDSSLEYSDLSLQQRKNRRRRNKCLVCRQKISEGEGIRYMHFYFCCRSDDSKNGIDNKEDDKEGDKGSSCFRCSTCRRSLDPENEEEELQIISSARRTVIQCGACVKQSMMGLSTVASTSVTYDEAEEEDIAILKASMHVDDSDSAISDSEDEAGRIKIIEGGSDHVYALSKAAKQLADKVSVKLSLSASSGRSSENEKLASLYFLRSEEGNLTKKPTPDDLTAGTTYELDSDAFGNPNYDGYACSVSNFDDNQDSPPRVTSVPLPKLDTGEIDGAIDERLRVAIRWVDEDGDDGSSSDGSNDSSNMPLRPAGPAMLSIEPFGSTAINKDTLMKVLRQTWEYEDGDGVTYEFVFVVPFKKIYISWEIDNGDELDLTQCRLKATVTYDPPEPESEEDDEPESEEAGQAAETVEPISEEGTPMNESHTNKLGFASDHALPAAATVNDVKYEDGEADTLDDQSSMPGEVYVRTTSIDHTTLSSTGCPSSIILRRNKGALDPDRDENDNFSELLSVASCIHSSISLPFITYVKVEKTEFEGEVGLSLIEKNGATVVAEVSQSGLFANHSQIKEGCEILAVNGQCVRGPRSVMRIMKDITGHVQIMASNGPSPPGSRFVVTKTKSMMGYGDIQSKSDPEMHSIVFETVNGLVRVKDIAKDGIFADSPISKGDICLSVDGVPAISCDVAKRALRRSQSIVAMLMFSVSAFWKSTVEFIIDEKYNRWWKKENVCALLLGEEDCTPITLTFDETTGMCQADGNEENEVDLRYINIIIDRVLKLLKASIAEYRNTIPKERGPSRSLSVSASGQMKNRSDVYRRALIKLDEMRENGTLSAEDYEAGRHALAAVAIQTAK